MNKKRILLIIFIMLFGYSCNNNENINETKLLINKTEEHVNNPESYDSEDEYEPTDSLSQDSDSP